MLRLAGLTIRPSNVSHILEGFDARSSIRWQTCLERRAASGPLYTQRVANEEWARGESSHQTILLKMDALS